MSPLKGNAKKITAKRFVKDINSLGNGLASSFVEEVILPELQKRYSSEDVAHLIRCVHIDGSKLSVVRGENINDTDYGTLWKIIEYGMMDKGVLPNPILRKEFPKTKKDMKENLVKLLTGK
jgi:hypothetical protein